MEVQRLLSQFDSDFIAGVPDSALRPLCDYLMRERGISSTHVIAANEGNCAGLAAGAYLATGKIPIVYLQNSGIGNIVNPAASLLNPAVYGIPCIFLVGWRGEPGTKDEPQHLFQGQATLELLSAAGIKPFVIGGDTTQQEVSAYTAQASGLLAQGRQVAFVLRRDALAASEKAVYANRYPLRRERAIELITEASGPDVIVASTGKISRELFEIRERAGEPHCRNFLTVGSMGHTSSIALGIALRRPDVRVWCLEGDGAFLMHMGAAAVIGRLRPGNLIHVVLNNEAHESVGGMPTALSHTDLCGAARACGYGGAYTADSAESLRALLPTVQAGEKPVFLEVKTAIGSRSDLGRPTVPPQENRDDFMRYLATAAGETTGEYDGT